MNRPAGFRPVPFKSVGKLLLILGCIGVLTAGLDALTGWFGLSKTIIILSIVLIPVSLYLLTIPKEE